MGKLFPLHLPTHNNLTINRHEKEYYFKYVLPAGGGRHTGARGSCEQELKRIQVRKIIISLSNKHTASIGGNLSTLIIIYYDFFSTKKSNFIPVIALFMGLYSCDGPHRLLVNERNNYIMNTECGTIDISSSWFSTTTIKIVFNGEYKVLLDSIKIIGATQKYDYQNGFLCSFYKDGYESAETVRTDTVLNVSNEIKYMTKF